MKVATNNLKKSGRLLRVLVPMVALMLSACNESLESSSGCPILCPSRQLEAREVELDAVSLDASVASFPPLGSAGWFVLAASGDSLDSRVIIRFDSLPSQYTSGGAQIPVTAVDSANVRFVIDTTVSDFTGPFTIELYDVDTTAADTDFQALAPLFRAGRLLGSKSWTPETVTDTLSVPVDNAVLAAKIQQTGGRLRVGFRLVAASTVKMVMLSANQTRYPRLKYDPAPSVAEVGILELPPRSRTPAGDPLLAIDFSDYLLNIAGSFPLARNTQGADTVGVFRDSILAVGGIARRRIYLRFALPDSILRSSIVRATLILTKKPSSTFGLPDTLSIVPQGVFATSNVPLSKVGLLADTLNFFPLPPVLSAPSSAGEQRLELVNYIRVWNTETVTEIPLAISLRIGQEGRTLQELLFYSSTAAANLRPRLRITYIPRQLVGLP